MSEIVFRAAGGVPVVQGNEIAWNFGLLPATPQVMQAAEVPGLHERFPALAGKWDGKSTVCHHEAVRKVLGSDLKAHNQPTGTCGGRAGSRSLEILQCVLIAAGKRATFHPVSHAWPYYLARREFNMLGSGDGVASGAVPPVLAKYGALHREEAGDALQAGPRSDDIAGKWGAGQLPREEATRLEALAHDNLVTAMVRAKSAQELADGLASGGVVCQSDSQGYTMRRDAEGFCRPEGTWYHYQVRSGVVVTPRGRKGFAYDQSWGDTVPEGPLLPGWPGNCFGIDWNVQDQLCRNGEVHLLFGMDLWDLESGNVDVPWIFM